jgi:hypothetical protein
MGVSEFDWLSDEEVGFHPAIEKGRTLALPVKRLRRPTELIKADKALSVQQRMFRDCILNTRSYKEAIDLFDKSYSTVDRTTAWRWRKLPKFVKALELGYQYMAECAGVTREKFLVQLEQIRDTAMTPRPILYRGEPTGFEEYDPASALKALDQQAKLAGFYGEEKTQVAVNLQIDFGSYGTDADIIEGEVVEAD